MSWDLQLGYELSGSLFLEDRAHYSIADCLMIYELVNLVVSYFGRKVLPRSSRWFDGFLVSQFCRLVTHDIMVQTREHLWNVNNWGRE